ncbi:MAG: hypothetical protein H6672_07195 [Anaerolineaceae bacterium]|nr:hypothetical protein [Anaerolineaceae bacterium]
MRRFRPQMILLLFAALLLAAPLAFAQDTFGLDSQAFSTWQTAWANTLQARSFHFDTHLELQATSAGESVGLVLDGNGEIITGSDPQLRVSLTGTAENIPDVPASFQIELRVVNGIGYVRGTDLTTGASQGWQQAPMDAVMASLSELLNSAGTDTNGITLERLRSSLELLAPATFIRLSSLPDAPSAGTLAGPHFGVDVDFLELFASPGFNQMLNQLLADVPAIANLPAGQRALIGTLAGTMFSDSAAHLETFIGGDQYVHRITADIGLNINPSVLGVDGDPTNIMFQGSVMLVDFNAPFPIRPPEDLAVGNPPGQLLPTLVPPTAIPVQTQPQPGTPTLQPGVPFTVELDGRNPAELVYPVESPQTVTFIAHSPDGNVDTLLRVFAPDGSLLSENDDLANGRPDLLSTDSVIPELALSQTGLYRIVVDSFTGINVGPVEILVEVPEGSVIERPTQSGGDFQPVPPDIKYVIPGQSMRIYIPDGHLDFLLVLEGNGRVTVSANRLDNVFDPLLEVRDAQGNILVSNDDANNGTRNALIADWQPPTPGVYTVRVSSFTGADAGGVELIVDIR